MKGETKEGKKGEEKKIQTNERRRGRRSQDSYGNLGNDSKEILSREASRTRQCGSEDNNHDGNAAEMNLSKLATRFLRAFLFFLPFFFFFFFGNFFPNFRTS